MPHATSRLLSFYPFHLSTPFLSKQQQFCQSVLSLDEIATQCYSWMLVGRLCDGEDQRRRSKWKRGLRGRKMRERSWRRWRGYKGQGGVRYGEEEVREEEAAVAAAAFSRRQHSLLMLTGSTLFLRCHTTGRCSTSIKQHYGNTSLEPKQSSTLLLVKLKSDPLL